MSDMSKSASHRYGLQQASDNEDDTFIVLDEKGNDDGRSIDIGKEYSITTSDSSDEDAEQASTLAGSSPPQSKRLSITKPSIINSASANQGPPISSIKRLPGPPLHQTKSVVITKGVYGDTFIAVKMVATIMKGWQERVREIVKLNHPRVIRYFGVLSDQPKSLIMELMEMSLYTYYTTQPRPSELTSMRLGWHVCMGMSYLKNAGVCHGNLTSQGVLVGRDERGVIVAKIGGLDCCSEEEREEEWDAFWREDGGLRRGLWMEPEELKANTPANDLYGTTVVLTEIFSWSGPFGRPLGFYWPRLARFLTHLRSKAFRLTHLTDIIEYVNFRCTKEVSDKEIREMEKRQGSEEDDDDEKEEEEEDEDETGVEVPKKRSEMPFISNRFGGWRQLQKYCLNWEVLHLSGELYQKGFNPATIDIDEEVIRMEKEIKSHYEFPSITKSDDERRGETLPGPPIRKRKRRPEAIYGAMTTFTNDTPSAHMYFDDIKNFTSQLSKDRFLYRAIEDIRIGLSRLPIQQILMGTDKEDAKSRNLLAACYEVGRCVPQNSKEAVRLYRLAAEEGSGAAMCNLARCLEIGLGGVVDVDEALDLSRVAAQRGYPAAMTRMGLRFLLGNHGVKQNFEEAVKWFRDAVKKGDMVALNNYICMLQRGMFVQTPQHRSEIQEGLMEVCTPIDVIQNNMACFLASAGQVEKAAEMFKAASRHRLLVANYNYGLFLKYGIGGRKDEVGAHLRMSGLIMINEKDEMIAPYGLESAPEPLAEGLPGFMEFEVKWEGAEKVIVRGAVFFKADEWPVLEI
ncbi:hypothetical protein HDU67_006176 [Dinochytrium kinnereticum]|nr:hypothetical protein HDU67_006176 [Dinochytrium kinnereticum]